MLFSNTDIPLGARVEFNFQWSKWIKDVSESHAQTPANRDEYRQSNQANQSLTGTSESNRSLAGKSNSIQSTETNPTGQEQPPLVLNSILQSNQYGASFLKAVSEKKPLNDNLRQLLCNAILQYCIEQKRDLSVKDSASLARQICNAFSGELMVFSFFFEPSFSFDHIHHHVFGAFSHDYEYFSIEMQFLIWFLRHITTLSEKTEDHLENYITSIEIGREKYLPPIENHRKNKNRPRLKYWKTKVDSYSFIC